MENNEKKMIDKLRGFPSTHRIGACLINPAFHTNSEVIAHIEENPILGDEHFMARTIQDSMVFTLKHHGYLLFHPCGLLLDYDSGDCTSYEDYTVAWREAIDEWITPIAATIHTMKQEELSQFAKETIPLAFLHDLINHTMGMYNHDPFGNISYMREIKGKMITVRVNVDYGVQIHHAGICISFHFMDDHLVDCVATYPPELSYEIVSEFIETYLV